MEISTLKQKRQITREDIGQLLASIGKPGKNRDKKLKALQDLNRQNRQGHDLSVTAESYGEW